MVLWEALETAQGPQGFSSYHPVRAQPYLLIRCPSSPLPMPTSPMPTNGTLLSSLKNLSVEGQVSIQNSLTPRGLHGRVRSWGLGWVEGWSAGCPAFFLSLRSPLFFPPTALSYAERGFDPLAWMSSLHSHPLANSHPWPPLVIVHTRKIGLEEKACTCPTRKPVVIWAGNFSVPST